MGNSVGEGIWDNHPIVKADADKARKENAKALKAVGAKNVKPTSPLNDSGGHVKIKPPSSARTTPGISGIGGSNVGGLYKPMGGGGGMNWSTK